MTTIIEHDSRKQPANEDKKLEVITSPFILVCGFGRGLNKAIRPLALVGVLNSASLIVVFACVLWCVSAYLHCITCITYSK
jgi:hypothetical protein